MSVVSQHQTIMESGEAVDTTVWTVWKTLLCAPLIGSPGAVSSLSDAEIAAAAAQSGSFDFLNRPEEDLYTLEDGQEV